MGASEWDQTTLREAMRSRPGLLLELEEIARKYLEYNVPQRDLTYEMMARELAPGTVDDNYEQFTRDVLRYWNRPVLHLVPTLAGSTALCGRPKGALDPILDGHNSFLHTYYNCSQDEACPECWHLRSPIE